MKDRRIDITAEQRKEHLPQVLATMVQKAIEIKTNPDDTAKFKKAIEKGKTQVFGHLGKRLAYALDFGGAGKDDSAVGVCLTPLSIEVIKMSLSNVGTKKVALNVTGTGCVPLLGQGLLTEGQKEVFAADKIDSNGFLLLAAVLMDSIAPEYDDDLSVKQISPREEELSNFSYLGSGAFSNVFKIGNGEFFEVAETSALSTHFGT